MTAKRTAFGDFLVRTAKESHLAEDKIREILRGVGYMDFDPKKTALYRTAIMAYCLHQENILTVAKQQPEPCPIPNCTGYKDRGISFWPWVCTIGKLRHYLVDKATFISGIPALVLLEKINGLSAKEEIQVQTSKQDT